MAEYFSEKSFQIEPGAFVAFGIPVSSRYSKASEIKELIDFAEFAAIANVSHYIKNVFYDSKANLCTFELDISVKYGDPIAQIIKEIAEKTISQYQWFDIICNNMDIAA